MGSVCRRLTAALVSALITAVLVTAHAGTEPAPSIALIIDDLGNRQAMDSEAVDLPGPVACAFLPDGYFTRRLAQQAHARNKEVLLHLPMQAVDHDHPQQRELKLDMSWQEFTLALQRNADALPYLDGINNHRGSLLTRHPGHMAWLMQFMQSRDGLFFVDSRTTAATVAQQLANEYGIPNIERKVFLDNDPSPEAVKVQFRLLLELARRDGTALGIGHPYPATLAMLRQELGRLGDYNISLVPVSRLIELANRRAPSWQASWSR